MNKIRASLILFLHCFIVSNGSAVSPTEKEISTFLNKTYEVSRPHAVKFTNLQVKLLKWPDDVAELQNIRNANSNYVNQRPEVFEIIVNGIRFRLIAGVARNTDKDRTLMYPDKEYPYNWYNKKTNKIEWHPLNYVCQIYMIAQKGENPQFELKSPRSYPYFLNILDNCTNEQISCYGKNILKVFKGKKDLVDPNNIKGLSVETAAIILTSERFRGPQSLVTSYVGFYHLKKATNNARGLLHSLFNEHLIFPVGGGAEAIANTKPDLLLKKHLNSLYRYLPRYQAYLALPDYVQKEVKDEFIRRHVQFIKFMAGESASYTMKFRDFLDMEVWEYNQVKDELCGNDQSEEQEDYWDMGYDPHDPWAEGHHEDIRDEDFWESEWYYRCKYESGDSSNDESSEI